MKEMIIFDKSFIDHLLGQEGKYNSCNPVNSNMFELKDVLNAHMEKGKKVEMKFSAKSEDASGQKSSTYGGIKKTETRGKIIFIYRSTDISLCKKSEA